MYNIMKKSLKHPPFPLLPTIPFIGFISLESLINRVLFLANELWMICYAAVAS